MRACTCRALQYQLDVTLFERLNRQGGLLPLLLDTQYRMHPALSAFPSQQFYGSRLKDGVGAQDKPTPRALHWPEETAPMVFLQASADLCVRARAHAYHACTLCAHVHACACLQALVDALSCCCITACWSCVCVCAPGDLSITVFVSDNTVCCASDNTACVCVCDILHVCGCVCA